MSCVREILTSVKELLSSDDIRELVEHLAIISKFLYKISNAQSHFKFFRAFRKIDRNMMKYTDLGLVQFARKNLELLDGADHFSESFAEEYTTELETMMKKSAILLDIVMSNCMEGVSLCKLELATQRFIGQNIVLIGSGSKVYCVVKSLVKGLKRIYGHLCAATKRSDNLEALLKSNRAVEEKQQPKKKRKRKKAALQRFGNNESSTTKASQVNQSQAPKKLREKIDYSILMVNTKTSNSCKSLPNPICATRTSEDCGEAVDTKPISSHLSVSLTSSPALNSPEDCGEPVEGEKPYFTPSSVLNAPEDCGEPVDIVKSNSSGLASSSLLNTSEDCGEPVDIVKSNSSGLTSSSLMNTSEDCGEPVDIVKSNSSGLTSSSLMNTSQDCDEPVAVVSNSSIPSQQSLSSVLKDSEAFSEKAEVILNTNSCKISPEIKKIDDSTSVVISGNDQSGAKKKRKRKRKKKNKNNQQQSMEV